MHGLRRRSRGASGASGESGRSRAQRRLAALLRGRSAALWAAGLVAVALAAGPGRGWTSQLLRVRSSHPGAAGAAVPGRPAGAAGAVAALPTDEGRGFSHGAHRKVQCTACHMSVGGHGVLKVRTNEDCVACHHGTATPAACVRCHTSEKLPPAGTRTVEVRTSVAKAPTKRALPFAHSLHGSVACQDCHGAAPKFATVKECSACHERHHTEARDCQRCHTPENVKSHPALASHTGCAGAGCHTDRAVLSLSWSRSVCLSCHQDRARHEAGRECAVCHQVPALHSSRKEVAR